MLKDNSQRGYTSIQKILSAYYMDIPYIKIEMIISDLSQLATNPS